MMSICSWFAGEVVVVVVVVVVAVVVVVVTMADWVGDGTTGVCDVDWDG